MRRLMKQQGYLPEAIVTDWLRSYGAAVRDPGLTDRHVTGGPSNNSAEVSHQPTRHRERQRRGLDHRARPNGPLPPMPPSTTTSTSSAT